MESIVKTYTYPNGEIQRVQLVRPEGWEQLQFLKLSYDPGALDCFADVYRNYLVPACPWLFGNMVMFHLPEDLKLDLPMETKSCGTVADPLSAAAAAFKANVRFRRGVPRFRDAQTEKLWRALEERGCIRVVRGKLPVTTPIPVGDLPGYLTDTEPDAQLKVNASFFIMDRFDCATVCDHVGTPLGLLVKDGVVENPPLYGREALLVKKDGTVAVTQPDIRETDITIGGILYRHGENAVICTRPEHFRTSAPGKKLLIVGNRVAAVGEKGPVAIPASGFVLCPKGDCSAAPGDAVTYGGMEDVAFGIQVGNSILRAGKKTEGFRSRFFNIRRLQPVPYPPSLYPMDFDRARAARIALGADIQGRPMVLWAEGAGKLRYQPGQDSCGASLRELGAICEDLGMYNAVNLDGGGSAQILLKGKRHLQISDRSRQDNSQQERPVPLALIIP